MRDTSNPAKHIFLKSHPEIQLQIQPLQNPDFRRWIGHLRSTQDQRASIFWPLLRGRSNASFTFTFVEDPSHELG